MKRWLEVLNKHAEPCDDGACHHDAADDDNDDADDDNDDAEDDDNADVHVDDELDDDDDDDDDDDIVDDGLDDDDDDDDDNDDGDDDDDDDDDDDEDDEHDEHDEDDEDDDDDDDDDDGCGASQQCNRWSLLNNTSTMSMSFHVGCLAFPAEADPIPKFEETLSSRETADTKTPSDDRGSNLEMNPELRNSNIGV